MHAIFTYLQRSCRLIRVGLAAGRQWQHQLACDFPNRDRACVFVEEIDAKLVVHLHALDVIIIFHHQHAAAL